MGARENAKNLGHLKVFKGDLGVVSVITTAAATTTTIAEEHVMNRIAGAVFNRGGQGPASSTIRSQAKRVGVVVPALPSAGRDSGMDVPAVHQEPHQEQSHTYLHKTTLALKTFMGNS